MQNTTAAATIPTPVDFKRSVHILETETDDDTLIGALIAAAVAVVDTGTAHPMTESDYIFYIPTSEWSCWWFPVRPVTALVTVEVMDAAGTWSEVDAASAVILSGHDEPRLKIDETMSALICDATSARVTATVGGLPDQQQRQAVLLIVREWFNAGISEDDAPDAKLSFAVKNLMDQVRYRRPQVIA